MAFRRSFVFPLPVQTWPLLSFSPPPLTTDGLCPSAHSCCRFFLAAFLLLFVLVVALVVALFVALLPPPSALDDLYDDGHFRYLSPRRAAARTEGSSPQEKEEREEEVENISPPSSSSFPLPSDGRGAGAGLLLSSATVALPFVSAHGLSLLPLPPPHAREGKKGMKEELPSGNCCDSFFLFLFLFLLSLTSA